MGSRFAALFFVAAAVSFAQGLTFGFVAGVPLTVLLDNDSPPLFAGDLAPISDLISDTTHRSILGASLGWRLRGEFSLEAEALHRHLDYQDFLEFVMPQIPQESFAVSASDWEFPLVLKYRLPGRVVRPYFSGGAALDVLTASSSYWTYGNVVYYDPYTLSTSIGGTTGTTSSPYGLQHKNVAGALVGFGLDLRCGPLHISPEIRYTRWTNYHFKDAVDNSRQNQAEFLIEIGH
jgi:hypothetical protein